MSAPSPTADTTLIIEGGGFKSAFTTGVLDAFQVADYRPFDRYLGVSGGSVVLSYFLSKQYRHCLESIRHLARNEDFTAFSRLFSERGYMDLDIISAVTQEEVVFDLLTALRENRHHPVHFVATDAVTGEAAYLRPRRDDWQDAIMASSALPFFTRGYHEFGGKKYLDGGCSDPLPARWAYEQGARKVLVVRTWPEFHRSEPGWPKRLGNYYYRADPLMKSIIDRSSRIYNEATFYLDNPPPDLTVTQLAPRRPLASGTVLNSIKTIMSDYGHGLDTGLRYVDRQRRESQT